MRFVFCQNGENFDNEARQYYQRTQRDAQEAKPVLLVVHCHDGEADGKHGTSDQHQDIIFTAESEV